MKWKFPLYEIDRALDWEALSDKFDWIEDMKETPQDEEWHGEGNVYTHTQMVVNTLVGLNVFEALSTQEKHILIASALLHDVEKRSTTREEEIDGRVRIISPNHAKKGERTARYILYKSIATPFNIRESICKLVRLHGFPLWVLNKDNPSKEVIYISQFVNTKHLALLARADALGRICPDKDDLLLRISYFEELCKENNCYGTKKDFKSNYGRYLFFNKKDIFIDYIPYQDFKFKVDVLCGLPGSGKDTYIKHNFDCPVLSLDKIRRAHKIAPTDKKKNGHVIQMAKEEAKKMMRISQSFIFNATNITLDMRRKWINLFMSYGAEVTITYIEVPYEVLLKQNNDRNYKVPEKIIEKLLLKLEIPTVKEAHHIEYKISTKKTTQ